MITTASPNGREQAPLIQLDRISKSFLEAGRERVVLHEVSAAFANGRCVAASGQAGATLAGPLAVTLPALSGQVSCENEWVRIPLAGGGGRIDLRIAVDGRYRIDMQVAAVNEAVAAALQAGGFRPAPGGYAIHRAGAF